MNSVSPAFKRSTIIRAEQAFTVFACLFITSLVSSKLMSGKYFLFVGAPVSCKDLIYPVTFLVIHIIAEVYGTRSARGLVIHGWIISILVTVLVGIANQLPIAATSPVPRGAFDQVFGSSRGTIITSLVAYLTAQLLNLYLFLWLKDLFNERYLWLRSNVATLCAQLVDTALLVTAVGVIGTVPGSPSEDHLSSLVIFLSQYAFKGVLTFVASLLVYGSVALARRILC